ncbi:ABC transporter permease [Streptococcus sp. NLN64]|uniref:ABC transporter permease n=1 Tax=Streptococcus sp. NLN64 TaxID=2822799 RepID=UPI0018CA54C5|nr:ABC transporter permease [Streptococcus sp. NLN64]MBG9368153.1 ABC transporter permease [Streptococcus sp. NLN64]
MFYVKLALQNIQKSSRIFAPFVLASLVLFTIMSAVFSLMLSPVIASLGSGGITLSLGIVVLTIFSLNMEIYSFKFLLQQRTREFGLYNMLGMNKKKVSLIASLELFFIFLLIVIAGSILGTIVSNLFYLLFVNLVGYHELNFTGSPLASFITGLIFAGIFLVLEFIAIYQIGKTNPLVLFRTSEKGEREPRGNSLFAVLALLSLGFGYYLSLSSKASGVEIILRFFIAVLLVIAGTYLFYMSFITWFLKRRRKNKQYFYQPEHFITTSQMIFRMKQHAMGLANITLLAVMTFVTIATTTSLYAGTNEIVNNLYPTDTSLEYFAETREQGENLYRESVLNSFPETEKNALSYLAFQTAIRYQGGESVTINPETMGDLNPTEILFTYLVTQDDFRKLGNQLPTLADNQLAFVRMNEKTNLKALRLGDQHFEVVQNLTKAQFPDVANTFQSAVLVVANDTVLESFKNYFQSLQLTGFPVNSVYRVLTNLSSEQVSQIASANGDSYLFENKEGDILGSIMQKQEYQDLMIGFTGGFLFTGFLIGMSFILGAALIIYYKQYSEGHEDKKSYKILQEIGMSQEAVRKTINSQIVILFFLPLAIAILHFLVSTVMLRQMLAEFGIYSSNLIYTVSAVTLILVAITYYIIYKWTSRTYYHIIER